MTTSRGSLGALLNEWLWGSWSPKENLWSNVEAKNGVLPLSIRTLGWLGGRLFKESRSIVDNASIRS